MGIATKYVKELIHVEGSAGFDVRAFTPNGATLDAGNFEAALNAALEAAHAACGYANSWNGSPGSVAVLIPPGSWLLQNGIFIKGQWTTSPPGPSRFSPSIIGNGPRDSVVLRFASTANFPGIGIGINPNGSIQQDSQSCTISNANPAVVTATAHGLTVDSTVSFTTTGSLPTGLTANQTYFVASTGLTANTFQVSSTIGGSAIATSSAGSGTHTLSQYGSGPYASGVTLQNVYVIGNGGGSTKSGIRARNTIKCTLRDVTVQGAGTFPGAAWHDRAAIDFRNNNVGEAPTPGTNHQHLYIERTSIFGGLIGFWFGEGLWSGTIIDGDSNGPEFAAMYEAAVIGWWGGDCQGSIDGARHSSGAMYTTGLPSGSGAAVTASSGGFSTVTGLSGLQGATNSTTHQSYKGSYLVLGSGTSAEIFRIEQVLSQTSCIVRRSNTGLQSFGAASGLAWEVRGCQGGNEVILSGQIYHETTSGPYYLETGWDFVSASFWTIESVQTKIANAIIHATGCQGQIVLRDCRGAGALVARLDRVSSFMCDRGINEIDVDDISRHGVIARFPSQNGAGMASELWDSRPRGMRYNSALIERGAIVFDARKSSSIVRSGADVTSWSDITGTVTLGQYNSGIAPQYLAVDPEMGAPAIQIIGNVNPTLSASLTGNIEAAFSAGRHAPTLMVVARIPVSAQVTGGTRRIGLRCSNGNLDAYCGFDDSQHSANRDLYAFYYINYTGAAASTTSGVSQNLVPSDTSAHWLYSTCGMSGEGAGGGGSDEVSFHAAFTVNGNYRHGLDFPLSGGDHLELNLVSYNGSVAGDLIVSHIAVFPHGLTISERAQFLDLARNEFNLNEV